MLSATAVQQQPLPVVLVVIRWPWVQVISPIEKRLMCGDEGSLIAKPETLHYVCIFIRGKV